MVGNDAKILSRGRNKKDGGQPTAEEEENQVGQKPINLTKEYSIALNRLGLNWDEFLFLTPREFYLALKDGDDLELQRVKPIADAIRFSTLWLVNIQLPRNKKIRKPEKLWTHYWDQFTNKVPQTKEQMVKTMKFIAGAFKSNKKARTKRREKRHGR